MKHIQQTPYNKKKYFFLFIISFVLFYSQHSLQASDIKSRKSNTIASIQTKTLASLNSNLQNVPASIITVYQLLCDSQSLQKTIILNADFTLSNNNLTVSPANQLSISADQTDKATIQVMGSIQGISKSLYNNITLNESKTSNLIDSNLIINGDFTVQSDLSIAGDLIVKSGTVLIEAALNVSGHIILDGTSSLKTFKVSSTGSLTGKHICIRNFAATTNPTIDISGNLTATKGDIIFDNNSASTSGQRAIHIKSTATISVHKNFTITSNTSTNCNAVTIEKAIVAPQDINISHNTNSCLVNPTVDIQEQLLSTYRDIIISHNTNTSEQQAVYLHTTNANIQAPQGDIIITNNSNATTTNIPTIDIQGTMSAGNDIVVSFNNSPASAVNIQSNITAAKHIMFVSNTSTGADAVICNATITAANILIHTNKTTGTNCTGVSATGLFAAWHILEFKNNEGSGTGYGVHIDATGIKATDLFVETDCSSSKVQQFLNLGPKNSYFSATVTAASSATTHEADTGPCSNTLFT